MADKNEGLDEQQQNNAGSIAEGEEVSKELRTYMVKAIESYSLKADIIKRHKAVTVTALENLLEKVHLETSELLEVHWDKGLVGQKDEVLKAIYEKINYKPTSPRELALEYTLKISKKLGKNININQVSFNTLIDYADASGQDANKYSDWVFGLNGTNSLVHQNTEFLKLEVGA